MSAGHVEPELLARIPRHAVPHGSRGETFFSRVLTRIAHGAENQSIAKTLCEIGTATTGVILDKSVRTSHIANGVQTEECVLSYQFVPLYGTPVRGEQVVQRYQWDSVQIGEKLTVLYLDESPSTSRIYKLIDYRACV